MKQFVILALILSVHSIFGLQFKDCGSQSGKFTKVTVSDCDTTKNDCILKRNSNVTISIEFSLSEDVTAIKTVVHGKVLGVPLPFHLDNPDACHNDSGLKCPLAKGAKYKYTASLPILKVYPKVSVVVKWELRDQKNNDVVCVLIPAKIK